MTDFSYHENWVDSAVGINVTFTWDITLQWLKYWPWELPRALLKQSESKEGLTQPWYQDWRKLKPENHIVPQARRPNFRVKTLPKTNTDRFKTWIKLAQPWYRHLRTPFSQFYRSNLNCYPIFLHFSFARNIIFFAVRPILSVERQV